MTIPSNIRGPGGKFPPPRGTSPRPVFCARPSRKANEAGKAQEISTAGLGRLQLLAVAWFPMRTGARKVAEFAKKKGHPRWGWPWKLSATLDLRDRRPTTHCVKASQRLRARQFLPLLQCFALLRHLNPPEFWDLALPHRADLNKCTWRAKLRARPKTFHSAKQRTYGRPAGSQQPAGACRGRKSSPLGTYSPFREVPARPVRGGRSRKRLEGRDS